MGHKTFAHYNSVVTPIMGKSLEDKQTTTLFLPLLLSPGTSQIVNDGIAPREAATASR